MIPDAYTRRVRRLEAFARQNPTLYRTCVGFLAILGYFYIFLVLAVLLGLIGLIIYCFVTGHVNIAMGKVLIALCIFALVIAQSLWVVIDHPRGTQMLPRDAPALFGMIRGLSSALKAPLPHKVLITNDLNAGIMQVPRLGILGWQQNYLILGLPLMRSLTTEQFRAVLAHEFGHLSGNHSRFGGWVYRVRQTWVQLLINLIHSGHRGVYIFLWFFRWYAPFFAGYSFALARLNEYEADRAAADVVGRQVMAESLLATHIAATMPPNLSLQTMPPQQMQAFFQWSFSEETRYDDTHPSLADRLGALGYRPTRTAHGEIKYDSLPIPPPVQQSAADQLLGNIQGLMAHMQFQQQYGAR